MRASRTAAISVQAGDSALCPPVEPRHGHRGGIATSTRRSTRGPEDAGAVAPKVVSPVGELHHSLRRFPRLRSTYSQAFFLHRLVPRALWADETIRRAEAYTQSAIHEWVSGACVLVRRMLLEQLDGLDDGFFLYCEDTDLASESDRPATTSATSRRRSSFTRAAPPLLGRACCVWRRRAVSDTRASTGTESPRSSSALGSGWAHSPTCSSAVAAPRAGPATRNRLRQVASRGAENAWPDG